MVEKKSTANASSIALFVNRKPTTDMENVNLLYTPNVSAKRNVKAKNAKMQLNSFATTQSKVYLEKLWIEHVTEIVTVQ